MASNSSASPASCALLTPWFVEQWRGRMLNIHPALLPSYRGLHTHARALDDGVKIHGATVHFVVPEMDAGPIVVQAAVPVLSDDTPDALGARVLAQEHRIYPLALKLVASGAARIEGARVLIEGEPPAPDALLWPARLNSVQRKAHPRPRRGDDNDHAYMFSGRPWACPTAAHSS